MKESVSMFEGFKGLRFWSLKLEFSEDISIFSTEWEQKGLEQRILTHINHFQ